MDGSVFTLTLHDEDYLQQVSRPIANRLAFIEQLSLVLAADGRYLAAAQASESPTHRMMKSRRSSRVACCRSAADLPNVQ